MKRFLDTSYPFRGVAGLPLLPRVYAPSMTVRRRPRRDNADVALADHALLIAGRVAGPVAVVVLTFVLTLPMVTP
jgi:hypothetical protein